MKSILIFILQMSVFSYTEITFPKANDRASVWTRFLLCATTLMKLPEGTDFQTSLCTQQGWVRPQWTLSVCISDGTTVMHVLGGHNWEEDTMVHFPAGTLHPPQTTAWSWNVVNETWERPPTGDNPGPRLQHNTLDSCSHNNSIPSPFHTTALH